MATTISKSGKFKFCLNLNFVQIQICSTWPLQIQHGRYYSDIGAASSARRGSSHSLLAYIPVSKKNCLGIIVTAGIVSLAPSLSAPTVHAFKGAPVGSDMHLAPPMGGSRPIFGTSQSRGSLTRVPLYNAFSVVLPGGT
jgi:hypothetical protein